jgi:hypothetical protein
LMVLLCGRVSSAALWSTQNALALHPWPFLSLDIRTRRQRPDSCVSCRNSSGTIHWSYQRTPWSLERWV